VIDFYADWCMPCKELDRETFSDRRVAAELDRFVRLKADLTKPENALAKQYAIVGVPTLVFLDGAGKEVTGARLTGFEPPDAFVRRAALVK
jgi:thiol:disulfide interchange protein DsbD